MPRLEKLDKKSRFNALQLPSSFLLAIVGFGAVCVLFVLAVVSLQQPAAVKRRTAAELETINRTVEAAEGPKVVDVELDELRGFLDSHLRRKRLSISIVAACHNRAHDMDVSLQTWLRVKNVDEIILVDWSSSNRASFLGSSRRSGELGKKLVLVRVEDQKEWVLTRAYNLAIKVASGSWILKVDCDTLVHPDFVDRHPIQKGAFYSLKFPRNSNEARLSGVLFAGRDDLLNVHGYDERLVRYGYEEKDLLRRLSLLDGRDLDPEYISHIPHSDPTGTTDVGSIRIVSSEVNKAVLESSKKWTEVVASDVDVPSSYKYTIEGDPKRAWWVSAEVQYTPHALEDVVGANNESALVVASKRVLHDKYSVPWDVVSNLSTENLFDLLLMVCSPILPGRILFVDAGKSMISVLSAVAAAARMERPLVLTWDGSNASALVDDLWDIDATNDSIAEDNSASEAVSYAKNGKLTSKTPIDVFG